MIYILFFLLFFLGHGAFFSAISPYILSHFSQESSAIFAAGQIAYPLGFFISGYISDRYKRLRTLILVSLLVQAPSQLLLFSMPDSLVSTVIFACLTRFFFAASMNLMTVATIESAGALRFGYIRSYGTLGFFIIHVFLFLLETNAGMFALPFHEDPAASGRIGALFILLSLVPSAFTSRRRTSEVHFYFRQAIDVFRNRPVFLYVVASYCFYFSYQIVDYYLGRFLQTNGSMAQVYGGWALAVLLEIPFMPLASRINASTGTKSLFYISLCAGTLRFAWISAYIAGVNTPPVIFSQLLHGIHFTGYYMGSLFWLRRAFPDHLFGTGSGIFNVVAALGGMSGNFFFGHLLFLGKPAGQFAWQAGADSPFLVLFGSAMLIQCILFFCFIFLPYPAKQDKQNVNMAS